MQPNKRLYLSPPHMSGREIEYINETFASNWIAPLGPQVNGFEQELAEYAGVKGALALSSGTAAIHLALRLLDVGPGDVVFCSSFTFIGSINPVLYLGAEPVFIDSDPDSWNMSPTALNQALVEAESAGRLPKAVIVVDLYGQSADYDSLSELCSKYGVPLVEDAAEALGSSYRDKKCGAFGSFGIFSFNGNKIITTSGGGMLLSDDQEALDKGLFWATQARDKAPWYQHSEMGYNYRMSNVVAAIGRGQLEVLEDRVETRRAVFDRYVQGLGDLPGVGFMPEAGYGRSNRWLTVMVLDPLVVPVKPMDIVNKLEEYNIESRPLWKPMHLQPLFTGCKYYRHFGDKSVSDELFASGVCLPSGTAMTLAEQNRVIECIKSVIH